MDGARRDTSPTRQLLHLPRLFFSLCDISTLYIGFSLFGERSICRGELQKRLALLLPGYVLLCNYGHVPDPYFQKLKRVHIIPGSDLIDDREFMDLDFWDTFQFFHRLPLIEEIIMDGVTNIAASLRRFVSRTRSMRSIHVTHADVPSSSVGTIISIPKTLEELNLSVGEHHKNTVRRLDFDVDNVMLDRDRDADSSETLWDTDPDEKAQYGEQSYLLDKDTSVVNSSTCGGRNHVGNSSVVGPLRDYPALSHLSIGIRTLLWTAGHDGTFKSLYRLVDALPANLEHLGLYGYTNGEHEELDDHVAEFMEKKAAMFPKLSNVEGVDEDIEDIRIKYGHDPEEGHLYEREFDFKEWEWEEA
ncbi:hypothetical protein QQS21_003497 [Conoideocrella luteorostrata]|uniref:Uncharacterized protein n=1 Tax=Conoideocrella luteorostrata TaxID=1105319 RepID=A0AAJ0CXB2_9HYPO|nr:hypothetical protein QQS21_003497 [Conoideocrella luteorostrata]